MTATITLETVHADGTYIATVEAAGTTFAAHYILGEVRLYGIAGINMRPAWKHAAKVKAAKAAVAARIEALGAEFAAAHKKLYAEEA